jgi:hypothetical protein
MYPKLAREVPELEALSIKIAEQSPGAATVDFVRHVVVATAPALFESRCTACPDGMHDFTSDMRRALHAREARIVGEGVCNGFNGAAACGCVLSYQASATYRS